MEEKEIFKQAKLDWEELKKLHKEKGVTEYGIVKGFVRNGELEEFVSVNMGNGNTLVFKSIEALEFNLK